ncbi:hypothetical protein SP5_030_00170 [Sphingomonas parapaucimobilis NBRC 15100]|uniref:Uncharacterized protein n=1 Tax=Sphingomonas parapaucimobilis NBRC 15100 TaxID=1219049 RepID=A0A0A1W4J3_9SPHN|nr:hypothetical protein SP5_030_00170 [Sphingomonas parapaucimobilis NBRC 15100]
MFLCMIQSPFPAQHGSPDSGGWAATSDRKARFEWAAAPKGERHWSTRKDCGLPPAAPGLGGRAGHSR